MASIQRMMKSGIRLYNSKPRGINLTASPNNRAAAPANLYRSLRSSSCGDRRSILSNIKSSDDVDTYARVIALKTAGLPLQQAQVLAKAVKDLPESKFDSLVKSIRLDQSHEKKIAESKMNEVVDQLLICGYGGGLVEYDILNKGNITAYLDIPMEYNRVKFSSNSEATNIIQETMRLYPPSPTLATEVSKDMKIGGVQVPRGVTVWTMVATLHTDPNIWGPYELELNSERFQNGISDACKNPNGICHSGSGSACATGNIWPWWSSSYTHGHYHVQLFLHFVPGHGGLS